METDILKIIKHFFKKLQTLYKEEYAKQAEYFSIKLKHLIHVLESDPDDNIFFDKSNALFYVGNVNTECECCQYNNRAMWHPKPHDFYAFLFDRSGVIENEMVTFKFCFSHMQYYQKMKLFYTYAMLRKVDTKQYGNEIIVKETYIVYASLYFDKKLKKSMQ